MPQKYQTSHLTLRDIQSNNVLAEDLIELCIELGEEYGDFGFTSYIPESSVTAALQPTLLIPASPLSRNRLEQTILHGLGEAERSAREKAIHGLVRDKQAPYEEAIWLMELRWEVMQKDQGKDGLIGGNSEESLNEWKEGDLYEKVAIWYRHQYPPPEDPRDVEVLLNDGHSGELKTVRLHSKDSIDKVISVLKLLSQKRNDEDKLMDSGSGPWMYQLMNARKKSVIKRRKLETDRDYRTMIIAIKGKNTKTPYAVVVQVRLWITDEVNSASAHHSIQESTPIRMNKEGPPVRKQAPKPVKGVDIPEDVVLEDGTVLTADIDWDAYIEKEYGKGDGKGEI